MVRIFYHTNLAAFIVNIVMYYITVCTEKNPIMRNRCLIPECVFQSNKYFISFWYFFY